MTTKQRLGEIREREAKATSGPWHPCGCRYTMIFRELNDQEIEDIAEVCNHFQDESQIEINKNFIAHARTDIPYLLELVEKYRSELLRITICSSRDSASFIASEALKDDET